MKTRLTPAERMARAKARRGPTPRPKRVAPVACRAGQIRSELRLTLEEVALVAGISPSGLWKIEQGKHRPNVETARRLAAFYGRTLNELWPAEVENCTEARPS